MNIIIIGAGDIGYQLSRRLASEKHSITIIEADPDRAAYSREHLDALVIEGSGSSPRALIEAGAKDAELLAALTNNDEVNILACLIAKKMGAGSTIARVRNTEFESKQLLEDFGWEIDHIIQPEMETAKAIIRLVRQSGATDIIEFDEGRIRLIGLRLDENSPVMHTPLKDLGKKFGNPPITIVAIKRRQYTIVPRGGDMLLKGDQVFFIYAPDYYEEAMKYFGKQDVSVEDLMIIGGGLIGRFVADELQKEMSVKVVERQETKSAVLADRLSDTLVIHGDGSDLDLLTLEGLTDMDEFIAVTGDDETNIISCLVARHLKVPRTISLINKSDYSSLAPTIGLDAVVSKQLITVNAIQKLIRQQQVAYFAELPGVDAEIIEFIAGEKSKITKKPLMGLHFPENAVVGAILRENIIIIPKGDTQINPGDKVIVFCLPQVLKDVEKFF